jgi:hypothetical protein
MGDERAHASGLGERQRLAIVAFGVLGTARCGDVSGQGEGLGLGKFAERPRFFHSLLTTRLGLIRAAATRLSLFGR